MPVIIIKINTTIRANDTSIPKCSAMPPTTPKTFLSFESASWGLLIGFFSIEIDGADGGTRTRNLLFTKQLLCQLSYVGLVPGERFELPKT